MSIFHWPSLTFPSAAESDVLALPLECLQINGWSLLYVWCNKIKGYPVVEIADSVEINIIRAKEEKVVRGSSREKNNSAAWSVLNLNTNERQETKLATYGIT